MTKGQNMYIKIGRIEYFLYKGRGGAQKTFVFPYMFRFHHGCTLAKTKQIMQYNKCHIFQVIRNSTFFGILKTL